MPMSVPSWATRRSSLLRLLEVGYPSFEAGSEAIHKTLREEITTEGALALLAHLSFCSVIPEALGHDSTEEKLFSKYTDMVLESTFNFLGFSAKVLEERADSADVDVHAQDYSFIADAKAFRLSRTAKNQKDFKVESMDKWRRGKDYALLVAPLFQYPSRSSQIYEQAGRRSVCLLSYPHLRAWIRAKTTNPSLDIEATVKTVLEGPTVNAQAKSAKDYWTHVNNIFRSQPDCKVSLGVEFRLETENLIHLVRFETQTLTDEIRKVESLSHSKAIEILLAVKKLPQRLKVVRTVSKTEVFDY